MFRGLFLGAAIATASVGGARAETWYVVEATRGGAIIIDADFRKSDQGRVYLTSRLVHPGINVNKNPPIIASQFKYEFDCKTLQFRTDEFALIDLDGRIPPGLSRSGDKLPDNVWRAAEDGKPIKTRRTFPPRVLSRTDCAVQYPVVSGMSPLGGEPTLGHRRRGLSGVYPVRPTELVTPRIKLA